MWRVRGQTLSFWMDGYGGGGRGGFDSDVTGLRLIGKLLFKVGRLRANRLIVHFRYIWENLDLRLAFDEGSRCGRT